jgi:hypothetical protein
MARAVWGRCGITFGEGTFTTVNADLDYPGWVSVATAPATLVSQTGGCGPNAVRVFYVGSIGNDAFAGRSAYAGLEAGYSALSRNAHPNLFPHELGHLFLGGNEEHRDGTSQADRVNVMRSDVGTIEGFPQVDQNQCARALAAVRTARFTGAGVAAQTLLGLPGQGVDAFETSSPMVGTSQTTTLRELLLTAPDALVSLGPLMVPQLIAMVTSDPVPMIRARAVTVLGQLSGVTAQMTLIGALQDPDPTVRAAAVRAVAAIGSPIAQASIARRVQVEPDPNVRALAHGRAMGLPV